MEPDRAFIVSCRRDACGPGNAERHQFAATFTFALSTCGNKIAGILPPQLVIASKRNGAYAGYIQLYGWISRVV